MKCAFDMSSLSFLSHFVERDGVRLLEANIGSIKTFPVHINSTELKSFFGREMSSLNQDFCRNIYGPLNSNFEEQKIEGSGGMTEAFEV